MACYSNESHEEHRWQHYKSDPMLADPVPPPPPPPLPYGAYYLVPAEQWSCLVRVMLTASVPPAQPPLRDCNNSHTSSSDKQEPQPQEPTAPIPIHDSSSSKPGHPFGKLPDVSQISFKHKLIEEPKAVRTCPKHCSPLLIPSRPVARSRLHTRRANLRSALFNDDIPPPEMLFVARNPRSLLAGNATGVNMDRQPMLDRDASALPKVTSSDYYVQPNLEELLARHQSTAGGYCHKVDNFVVGRKDHGEIRFIGRTDVRGLDVCDIIQFDKNQVFVHMDESSKPPVGHGLNKPAEITLFNIQSQGPHAVQQLEMMLREQAEKQGSHFISYDAIAGEWKFLVDHFSAYGLHLKTRIITNRSQL